MPFNSIIMPYKQNCKVEGEVITKFKIAKLYFAHNKKQRDIAHRLNCHYNTVGGIIKKCKQFWSQEVSEYLLGQTKLSESQLEVFNFLKSSSRRPKTNRRCLQGENEQTILSLHENASYGPKRMFKHLKRQGYDTNALYTLECIHPPSATGRVFFIASNWGRIKQATFKRPCFNITSLGVL